MHDLVRSFVMGVSIAAPVGPIGVLCMRRTLARGRLIGLLSGLGAATADGIYWSIAAFGLQVVSGFLMNRSEWLGTAGGAFLCYLGAKISLSSPNDGSGVPSAADSIGPWWAYASTFLLTLTNPMTILAFVGIMAGLGASSSESTQARWAVVAGVVLGSAAWWLTLTTVVGVLRRRITRRQMHWVSRLSGLVILAFGLRQLALLWGIA